MPGEVVGPDPLWDGAGPGAVELPPPGWPGGFGLVGAPGPGLPPAGVVPRAFFPDDLPGPAAAMSSDEGRPPAPSVVRAPASGAASSASERFVELCEGSGDVSTLPAGRSFAVLGNGSHGADELPETNVAAMTTA
ncbi:hypothetical protein [Streptomyces tsukubensis]|uniref:Uncharacterized protein n=1 Tax=Streptomyces tsukubensis TaxID=83656 RepID=A0A1V4A1E9_9ACTN|nr:hypothetical protein [Streptomyces tsukubensis]OON72610.1 hypothetical protein B1H18_28955 [Streptomyces tsukubensis]QFR93891.1 hypothetical protein GBW32_13445 [Streptomyces tsukubensis]